MHKEKLKEILNKKLTPKEVLQAIVKELEDLSYPKFNEKIGLDKKDSSIKNLMADKITIIPDDLALALEKEYGIPFKWWKTGEGPKTIEAKLTPEEKEHIEKFEKIADRFINEITDKELDSISECLADKTKKPLLMMFINKLETDINSAKKILLND